MMLPPTIGSQWYHPEFGWILVTREMIKPVNQASDSSHKCDIEFIVNDKRRIVSQFPGAWKVVPPKDSLWVSESGYLYKVIGVKDGHQFDIFVHPIDDDNKMTTIIRLSSWHLFYTRCPDDDAPLPGSEWKCRNNESICVVDRLYRNKHNEWIVDTWDGSGGSDFCPLNSWNDLFYQPATAVKPEVRAGTLWIQKNTNQIFLLTSIGTCDDAACTVRLVSETCGVTSYCYDDFYREFEQAAFLDKDVRKFEPKKGEWWYCVYGYEGRKVTIVKSDFYKNIVECKLHGTIFSHSLWSFLENYVRAEFVPGEVWKDRITDASVKINRVHDGAVEYMNRGSLCRMTCETFRAHYSIDVIHIEAIEVEELSMDFTRNAAPLATFFGILETARATEELNNERHGYSPGFGRIWPAFDRMTIADMVECAPKHIDKHMLLAKLVNAYEYTSGDARPIGTIVQDMDRVRTVYVILCLQLQSKLAPAPLLIPRPKRITRSWNAARARSR
jgi:hypothetical protein